MTREEAIEVIEQDIPCEHDTDLIEAFEMAIQALSQEPCDDAISREELLKAIDTWDKFGCNADTKLVPYQDHYIPYIHYDDVVKCIKGMPSVRPQEPKESEDKIIRRTLENFMRGLWEEIQVGELEYTTSEVYEMLEREIFTDNHVAISSAEPKTGHWIKSKDGYMRCDQCGSRGSAIKARFCHHCGAKMVEPQESGLTDEMMEHYKKLAEHYNGGKHESIQDTDDGK